MSDRFSFGLKGFGKGEWSLHASVGLPRGSKAGTKENKKNVKELKVLRSISKKIKERVSQETKDRDFLFLRESEDEENGKEYSLYLKVIPNQTRIRIGKTSYKTEKDYTSIEGRSINVKGIGIEFDKVSICPKVVSVKPRLGFVIGDFRTEDELQGCWSDVLVEEESEEDEWEEKED